MSQSIDHLINQISTKKVLVFGDVMVDSYYSGSVERISPEAPVPIVRVKTKDERLGGAANVALNVKALGATPIICAVIGKDVKGEIFLNLLDKRGLSRDGIVIVDDRPTTVKTRIISDGQQMIRVDEETTADLDQKNQDEIFNRFVQLVEKNKIEAVVYEDYNKGLLTHELISRTLKYCIEKNILTTVDPKKENFFSYVGCTLFKPNLKEVREGLKQELPTINLDVMNGVAADLRSKLKQQFTFITLSELGVYHESKEESSVVAAYKRDIVDVSGAGDTVIATVTLFLMAGATMAQAAELANLAGGLVCEYVGVVPIDKERLLKESKLIH